MFLCFSIRLAEGVEISGRFLPMVLSKRGVGAAMGPKPLPVPAPVLPSPYRPVEASWDSEEDAPGPRCGHTLTAVAGIGNPDSEDYVGPRLILFGGATAIEDGSSALGGGIRLAGVTNAVHVYDVVSRKWKRYSPVGEPPSPRAAHTATAVGTMVVIQGGIGPAGHSTDDLYVLDLTHSKFKWHRVVVQGPGPGPRYGHVMDLIGQRYLVTVSGNDGKRTLSDAWALDTSQKPYRWQRLEPEGDMPSARMYATASARADGMLLLCGGRDSTGLPQSDAYGLLKHRDGRWEWTLAPGVSPSPRYQHAAVFVDARLHVSGGALRGGRMVEGFPAISVLDTAAGYWVDRNGVVSSSRTNKSHTEFDSSLDLLKRCRHAAASVGNQIYIYGGLRGEILLDDLLGSEDTASRRGTEDNYYTLEQPHNAAFPNRAITADTVPDANSSSVPIMDKKGLEALEKASAAEAEAVSAHFKAARDAAAMDTEGEERPKEEQESVHEASERVVGSESHLTSDVNNPVESDVRLHHRAVVVAKEPVGSLGSLVRQLSLDQFENEGRRMSPWNLDQAHAAKRLLTRQKSPVALQKKVISSLLRPRNWRPPVNRQFFLDSYEVGELCYTAEQIFMQEPTVLQLRAPVKIFGDLHGQFGDLMRLFDEYGFPSTAGDITYIDYLFLGDYVDRGQHSLETITLLLALKIEYPDHVHLIRGNHEAADINALFGFRLECIERMGDRDGIWAWTRFNQLFNWLPLSALIEKKIICMHGGIGRSINFLEQIESLQRPISMDAGSIVLMDLLWSDPTENDSVEGLRPNARGPGLVTFGPDRVLDFCKKNKLQLIIRAHECVMDGFERFAQGHLITLFSATNYCGTANNAGALLVLGRELVVVPKLIHPLPPPIRSPESSPEHLLEETWMQELNIQRPPTPTRGRPQPAHDRSSLAFI